MDREQMEQWEKTREGGELSFVLVRGVLGWGLTMAVVGCCFTYFANPLHPANFWMIPVFIPALCLGAGYVFGKVVWAGTEKAYQDAKEKFEILDRVGPSTAAPSSQPPSQPGPTGTRVLDERVSQTPVAKNSPVGPPEPLAREQLATRIVNALVDVGLVNDAQKAQAVEVVSEAIKDRTGNS
jgi:hypothetical protein